MGFGLGLLQFSSLFLATCAQNLQAISINTEADASDNSKITAYIVGAWNNSAGAIVVNGDGTFNPGLIVEVWEEDRNDWIEWGDISLASGGFPFTEITQEVPVDGLLVGEARFSYTEVPDRDRYSFYLSADPNNQLSEWDPYMTMDANYYDPAALPVQTFYAEAAIQPQRDANNLRPTGPNNPFNMPLDFYRIFMEAGRVNDQHTFGVSWAGCDAGTTWVMYDDESLLRGRNKQDVHGTDLFLPTDCSITLDVITCSFPETTPIGTLLPACVTATSELACGSPRDMDETNLHFCFTIEITPFVDLGDPLPPNVTSYIESQYSFISGVHTFQALVDETITFDLTSPEFYAEEGVRVSFSGAPSGYSSSGCNSLSTGGQYSPPGEPCTTTFDYTPTVSGEYWTFTSKTYSSQLSQSAPITLRILSVLPPPVITSIDPPQGVTQGLTLTIFGENLGENIADANWVTVGGVSCSNAVFDSTNNFLTCLIAPGTGVDLPVIVGVEGQYSNSDFLFSFAPPTFSSIDSTNDVSSGGAESLKYIVIQGTNFGDSLNTVNLTIGGEPAIITQAAHTSVTFLSPPNCGSNFPMTMSVNGQPVTPALPTFTYDPPTLSAVATSAEVPTTGNVLLTLFGQSFCTSSALYEAFVGASACLPNGTSAHTDTFIECLLPEGSGVQTVSLSVNGVASASTTTIAYDIPVITSLDPSEIVSSGGQVTISGSNFGNTALVDKSILYDGGILSYSSWDHGQIVITFPEWYVADVELVVTTSGQSGFPFPLFITLPSISDVQPQLGATGGGDTIVVTGISFGRSDSATVITVGSTTAQVLSKTSTEITFLLPAGQGTGNVLSVEIDGNLVTWTYDYAAPVIDSINPAIPTSPSALLTITGSNFGVSSGSQISIGAGVCSFGAGSSWSHTLLVCTRPDGAGINNVLTVTVADQVSNVWLFNISAPVVDTISFSNSFTSGGGLLTLTGTSFTTSGEVIFGGQSLTLSQWDHSEVIAILPEGYGTVSVYLALADSINSNAFDFTYSNATLTTVTCDNPTTEGGSLLQLSGTSFDVDGTVYVDDVAITCSDWDHYQLNCTLPPGQGTVLVRLTTVHGSDSSALSFTYSAPAIVGINPITANTDGGALITVTGSNFGSSGIVTIGASVCSPVTYNDTVVVCTLAPLETVSSLTTGHGASTIEVSSQVSEPGPVLGLNYPTILGMSPTTSPTQGTGTLILSGTSFGVTNSLTADILVGSAPCTSPFRNHTYITCTIPAGTGTVFVSVTVVGLKSNVIALVYDPPTISSVVPDVDVLFGTEIVVTGANFGTIGSVLIDQSICVILEYDHTVITCSMPDGSGLDLTLTVTVAGQVSNGLPISYQLPTITDISPTSASSGGGTTLTINGVAFGSTGIVSIGSYNCPFSVYESSQILCTIPAGSGENLQVFVFTESGEITNSVNFSYSPPDITAIFPQGGSTAGSSITINGTSFSSTGSVLVDSDFGDVFCSVTSGAFFTDTQVICLLSAGVGQVSISISANGLPSNSVNYTYGAPVITSVEPALLETDGSDVLTLVGTNFGLIGEVTLDGTGCTLTGAGRRHDRIECTCEPGQGLGVALAVVAGSASTSTTVDFSPPSITSLFFVDTSTDGSGFITVYGNNFGLTGQVVTVNGQIAAVVNSSHTTIESPLPVGSGSGNTLTVTVGGQTSAVSQTFSYSAPSTSDISGCVDDFCPISGNLPLTITGSDFAALNAIDKTVAQIWYLLDGTIGESANAVVIESNGSYTGAANRRRLFASPSGTITGGTFVIDDWHSGLDGGTITLSAVNPGSIVDFTFAMWIKPSADGPIFSWGYNEIANEGVQISLVSLAVTFAAGDNIITGSALDLDTWHHIAITLDSLGSVEIFINSSSVQSESIASFAGVTWNGQDITLGSGNEVLDDFLMFNSVLSPDDIERIFVPDFATPSVTIGGLDCPVDRTVLTSTSLQCNIPAGTGFDLAVVVTLDSLSSSGTTLLTYQTPSVGSIETLTVTAPNTPIVINGAYFSDDIGLVQVRFQRDGFLGPTFDCSVTEVSTTSVTCLSPPMFGYDLRVQIFDGIQWGPPSSVGVNTVMPVVEPLTLAHVGTEVPTDFLGNLIGLSTSGDFVQFNLTNPLAGSVGRDETDAEWVAIYLGPTTNQYQYRCTSVAYTNAALEGLICEVPAGVGNDLVFTVIANGYEAVATTDSYSYPVAPSVTRVEGCPSTAGNATFECPTDGGSILLTVYGSDFPPANLEILLGSFVCPVVGTPSPDQAICELPVGIGANLAVVASNLNDPAVELISQPKNLVSYMPPSVSDISGCAQDIGSTTVDCDRFGGDNITIVGDNFGQANALVYLCNVLCEPLTHDSVSPHTQLVCTIPPGTQLDAQVIVVVGGQTATDFGLVSYTQCTPGSYQADEVDYDCTSCDVGTFTASSGQIQCAACQAGEYQNGTGSVACNTCPAGTFSTRLSDTQGAISCTDCLEGTANPDEGQAACTSCSPGTSQNETGGTTCTSCVAGKYTDQLGRLSCTLCAAGRSASLSGTITCNACPVGSYSSEGATACLPCPVGSAQEFSSSATCVLCDPGRYSAVEGQAKCVECDGGTFSNSTGLTECYQAEPGSIAIKSGSSGAIAPSLCQVGTYSSSYAQTVCLSCSPGSYADQTGQTECLQCLVGTYSSIFKAVSCQNCTAGEVAAFTGSDGCSACAVGRYAASDGLGVCTGCPPGTHQPTTGEVQCLSCGPGRYSTTSGQSTCKDCEVGFAINGTKNTACTRCNPGSYSGTVGSIACVLADPGYFVLSSTQPQQSACPVGTYSIGEGNTECTECPAGTYNSQTSQSTCQNTTVGYSSIAGSSQPTACQPGYFQEFDQRETCDICPAGYYSGLAAAACTPCPLGSFNTQPGMAACQVCGTGSFAPSNGSTDCIPSQAGYYQALTGQSDEVPCPAGQFNPNEGQPFCTSCPAGSFSDTPGSSECASCGSGTFAAGIGSQLCTNCSAGTIAASEGSSYCVDCESGTFASSDGASVCLNCLAGKYADGAGRSTCTDCSVGQIQPLEGQLSCDSCDAGYVYFSPTECVQCAPGNHSKFLGALDCSVCESGKYSALPGAYSCSFCPSGTISGSGATECTPCPVGFYSSSAGSDTCTGCAPGTYSSSEGTVTCTQCEAGRYSAAINATGCTICPQGAYCPVSSTEPVNCSAGLYSATLGQAACASCAVGFYTSDSGSVSCTACVAGTAASTVGSSICTACTSGKYSSTSAAISCTLCDVGKSSNATAATGCTACGLGKYQSFSGRATCDDCISGRYSGTTGQQVCSRCAAGNYQPSTGQDKCIACDQGKYQGSTGGSICLDCSLGRSNPVFGQPSCPDCELGKFGNTTGLLTCVDCSQGKYAGAKRSSSCKECPVGTYGAAIGQASCSECPAGFFQNMTKSTDCFPCAPGTSQPSAGEVACAMCPAGLYSPGQAALICIECAPGTYSNMDGAESCTPCDSGSYVDSFGAEACLPCPNGTASLGTQSTLCDACSPGSFSNDTGLSECIPCPVDTYFDDLGAVECLSCDSGRHAPFPGLSSCIACDPGTFSVNGSACEPCPEGTYQALGGEPSCVACPTGSQGPYTNALSCVECTPGTFSSTEGNANCSICSAGFYQDDVGTDACKPCPPGTASSTDGASLCVDCNPGQYTNQSGLLECLYCTAGKYQSNTSQTECALCPPGTSEPNTGAAFCGQCEPGFYANASGLTDCLPCAAGRFQGAQGQVECQLCPAGSYSTAGSSFCVPCQPGTFSEINGSVECQPCPAGSAQQVSGQSACDPCNIGTFNAYTLATACTNCNPGRFVNFTGALVCDACLLGKHQPNAGSDECLDCDVGTYASVTGLLICTLCAQGTYTNETGQEACQQCEIGRAQNDEGTVNCVDCVPGLFSGLTGQGSCLACESGTYTNTSGNIECVDCSPGRFQTLTGQTECTPCPSSTFINSFGASVCDVCPTGTFMNATGASVCTACPLGRFQLSTGSDACDFCEPGQYSPYEGLTECLDCPPGRFTNETATIECNACGTGSAQEYEGSIQCVECDAGFYSDLDGLDTCRVCPNGRYQNDTGAISCESCPAGKSSSAGSRTQCEDCSRGTYNPSVGQADCLLCARGKMYNLTGGTECDDCPEGTFQDTEGQFECLECVAGSVAPSTQTAECEPCLAGRYQPQPAQTTCEACPAGTAQPDGGSTSCDTCLAGTYASGGNVECSFCPDGSVAATSGQADCSRCPLYSSANPTLTSCLCDVGYAAQLSNDSVVQTECVECPVGADCDTVGTQWDNMSAAVGYWAGDNNEYYVCLVNSHCTGSNGSCALNRVGPLCAQCAPDYSESVDGTCDPCETNTTGFALLIVVVLLGVFLLGLNYYILLQSAKNLVEASMNEEQRMKKAEKRKQEAKNGNVQVSKASALELTAHDEDTFSRFEGYHMLTGAPAPRPEFTYKLKILLGFIQILTNVSTALEIQWPASFVEFLQNFNPANLDFVQFTNVDCLSDNVDFFFKMYVWAVTCPAIMLCIGIYYIYNSYLRGKSYSDKYQGGDAFQLHKNKVARKSWRLMYFTLFLVYPSVSTTILRTFVCKKVEGVSYLQADFSIQCYDDYWYGGAKWAILFTAIYPVGIPCFFLWKLWSKREKLGYKVCRAELGFLYDGYHRHLWYFELLDMMHKLTLTSLLAFLDWDFQLITAQIVTVSYLIIILIKMPYVRKGDDRLHQVAQIELLLLFMSGHLFNTLPPLDRSTEILVALLLVLITVGFLAWFGITSLQTLSKYLEGTVTAQKWARYKLCKPCCKVQNKRKPEDLESNEDWRVVFNGAYLRVDRLSGKTSQQLDQERIAKNIPIAKQTELLPPPPPPVQEERFGSALTDMTSNLSNFPLYIAVQDHLGRDAKHHGEEYLQFACRDLLRLRYTTDEQKFRGWVAKTSRPDLPHSSLVKQGFVRADMVVPWETVLYEGDQHIERIKGHVSHVNVHDMDIGIANIQLLELDQVIDE
jgi:hypothetical protein